MIQLRNKKSGKIATLAVDGALKYVQAFAVEDDSMERLGEYKTLAELNAEWEDVPEPKEYWAIDCFSPDGELVSQFGRCSERIIENRKQIGNYFETKEEAEKAVQKFKAWKRLKNNGFRFLGIKDLIITYSLGNYDNSFITQINKDLELLFGGEND